MSKYRWWIVVWSCPKAPFHHTDRNVTRTLIGGRKSRHNAARFTTTDDTAALWTESVFLRKTTCDKAIALKYGYVPRTEIPPSIRTTYPWRPVNNRYNVSFLNAKYRSKV